jgi:hypothetical protein
MNAAERRLRRGHPVEGLVCGYPLEPMPELALNGHVVPTELRLFTETNESFLLDLRMWINRCAEQGNPTQTERRLMPLLPVPTR